MGVGGGGGLAMSAAMAGMPIAAANKTTVMAFFIIFLRQFKFTSPTAIDELFKKHEAKRAFGDA